MPEDNFDQRVEAVRRFNRFYTERIGVLREGLLDSPFPLTEARVIYELAHQGQATATSLCGELSVDAGYMSRILRGFKARGLIEKERSKMDGRQSNLRLTEQGDEAFAQLNSRSHHEISAMLDELPLEPQLRLLQGMRTIERLLGGIPAPATPYILRPIQAGDLGWVVREHGVVYAEEYGWDVQFEALVAEIAAKFIQNHDPKKEHCWIAEKEGEIVGSVFVVKHSPTVAKLRLLLVVPKARGLGIGSRLVDECLKFARRAGYEKMVLWTNSALEAARHLYETAGFRLVHSEPHHSFGHDLVGETWEILLRPNAR